MYVLWSAIYVFLICGLLINIFVVFISNALRWPIVWRHGILINYAMKGSILC